ncbi:hypothetical protein [Amycolatopsis sp. NPDC059657]|uniref:hypothetical protein n=1 Tax=Amycolatopsis sp. NPDC059657 TaxID=3346899 RepID=UPI00366DF8D6
MSIVDQCGHATANRKETGTAPLAFTVRTLCAREVTLGGRSVLLFLSAPWVFCDENDAEHGRELAFMSGSDRKRGRARIALLGLFLSLIVSAQRNGREQGHGRGANELIGVAVALTNLPSRLREVVKFIVLVTSLDDPGTHSYR